jgi:ferredoxin-NADP reductase
VLELVEETAQTKSITLGMKGWSGHRAGQHVDVRLTAEDGYQAQRSYSIASAPEDADLLLTVERLDDGEVSPYLVDELRPGDELELRGPDRRLLRLGGAPRRTTSPRRRRLRNRAVSRDSAAPPGDQ